jgi:hypothetical protein
MLKRLVLCGLAVVLMTAGAETQTRFRSMIFLHHSTGGCIWGPNGGAVTVPGLVASYNRAHSLNGADSINVAETWWPSNDNEWTTWHDIFEGKSSSDNVQSYLTTYPVVMIKSCFPSSNMSGWGTNADTLSPTTKSVMNYKWHWRHIVAAMKKRPQNFFIIWTNAPLESGSTNTGEAARSDLFCKWAKDTLATGRDPVFGVFPNNVFVFDFFHILAGSDGILPAAYRSSAGDSHPNAAATAVAAPQLVAQICDAMLGYETATGVGEELTALPEGIRLDQNFPNPFNPTTNIRYSISDISYLKLAVYDLLGREVAVLVNEKKEPGEYSVTFDASHLASGVYVYRLSAETRMVTKSMTLVR